MSEEELERDLRDYSWKYFSYHADQRIKSFNFFLLFLTAILAGLLTHAEHLENSWFELGGGLSLFILAFLFWKLDRRHRTLVHVAENALKKLEDRLKLPGDADLGGVKLFNSAEKRTKEERKDTFCYFTCTDCFDLMFLIVAVLAAVVTVIGLVRLERQSVTPSKPKSHLQAGLSGHCRDILAGKTCGPDTKVQAEGTAASARVADRRNPNSSAISS